MAGVWRYSQSSCCEMGANAAAQQILRMDVRFQCRKQGFSIWAIIMPKNKHCCPQLLLISKPCRIIAYESFSISKTNLYKQSTKQFPPLGYSWVQHKIMNTIEIFKQWLYMHQHMLSFVFYMLRHWDATSPNDKPCDARCRPHDENALNETAWIKIFRGLWRHSMKERLRCPL